LQEPELSETTPSSEVVGVLGRLGYQDMNNDTCKPKHNHSMWMAYSMSKSSEGFIRLPSKPVL